MGKGIYHNVRFSSPKVYDTQIKLCDMPTLMRYLLDYSDETIHKFKDKCLPCIADYKYAMLRMEIFFICSACEMLDVENLLEVDAFRINSGFSTDLFSRFFNGDDVNIYTLDSSFKEKTKNIVLSNQNPENKRLYFQNCGNKPLQSAVELLDNLNGYTGIFIDNNSDQSVYKFIDDVFANDRIVFCAVHDMGDKKDKIPSKYKDLTLYSGSDEFVSKYSFLDQDLYNVLKNKKRKPRFGLVDTINRTEGKGFEVGLILNPNYKRR